MPYSEIFQFNHALLLSCLAIHCLLGASVFWIAVQYLLHRQQALANEARLLALPLPPENDLPDVLIQLPTFNEGALIARVAEAVKSLDWPTARLHVQILDDSTDHSTNLSEAAAGAWWVVVAAPDDTAPSPRASPVAPATRLTRLSRDFIVPPIVSN